LNPDSAFIPSQARYAFPSSAKAGPGRVLRLTFQHRLIPPSYATLIKLPQAPSPSSAPKIPRHPPPNALVLPLIADAFCAHAPPSVTHAAALRPSTSPTPPVPAAPPLTAVAAHPVIQSGTGRRFFSSQRRPPRSPSVHRRRRPPRSPSASAAALPTPSFRAKQADASSSAFASCEPVGLCSEESLLGFVLD
jgi:hypothetical protein